MSGDECSYQREGCNQRLRNKISHQTGCNAANRLLIGYNGPRNSVVSSLPSGSYKTPANTALPSYICPPEGREPHCVPLGQKSRRALRWHRQTPTQSPRHPGPQ